MHEPDEEGIECRVLGYRLDNAMGERIEAKALTEGWQEFVVVIERLSNGERVVEVFNLADLLALARDGAKLYTEDV